MTRGPSKGNSDEHYEALRKELAWIYEGLSDRVLEMELETTQMLLRQALAPPMREYLLMKKSKIVDTQLYLERLEQEEKEEKENS